MTEWRCITISFAAAGIIGVDGLASGQAPASRQPATPPRGSSGPWPARVMPINTFPNPTKPYVTGARVPEGRRRGSVSAVHVDLDGVHIWAGTRSGANTCVGSAVASIVKLAANGEVVQSFGAGLILWPHGIDVGNRRVMSGCSTPASVPARGRPSHRSRRRPWHRRRESRIAPSMRSLWRRAQRKMRRGSA